MLNPSKKKDPRFWVSAYKSGAVPQEQLPPGGLKIGAVATHYAGPADGCQTLSIGQKVVNSGPDWSVTEPVCAVVVPGEKYEPGIVLLELPKNSVPVDLFFFSLQ